MTNKLLSHTDIRNELEKRLMDTFSPEYLDIIDQSRQHEGHASNKGGAYFAVDIVTKHFTNVPLVQRHRQIYALANELIASGQIHALQINARDK